VESESVDMDDNAEDIRLGGARACLLPRDPITFSFTLQHVF